MVGSSSPMPSCHRNLGPLGRWHATIYTVIVQDGRFCALNLSGHLVFYVAYNCDGVSGIISYCWMDKWPLLVCDTPMSNWLSAKILIKIRTLSIDSAVLIWIIFSLQTSWTKAGYFWQLCYVYRVARVFGLYFLLPFISINKKFPLKTFEHALI